MSDDELEKLAQEMQNMSPSESARERGMEAAMAAFSLEFAQESVTNTQAENTERKNTTLSQGLADAPRPTGQSPLAERAQTLGRETMTRFSNVMNNFKFTPRAAMMGGSCMAALIVSMVFYDAGQFGKAPAITTDSPSQVAVVEPLAVEPVIAEPTNPKAPVAPKAAASVDANIGQSSDIKAQISVKASKAAPSQPQDRIASLEGAIAEFEAPKVEDIEADKAIREYRTALQQRDNVQLFVGQQEIVSQPQKVKNAAPSAIGQTLPPAPQITRMSANRAQTNGKQQAALSARPAKVAVPSAGSTASAAPLPKKLRGLTVEEVPSPAVAGGRINTNTQGQFTVFNGVTNQVVQSTQTIVSETGEILCRVLIPAKYKTITKQVLVSPAKSEKVIIPPVTKDIIVKLANDDGSFREVVKKVVIEEERVDFVITPAKYETRSERILVEPARDEWKPGSQAVNAGTLGAKVALAKPAPPKYILRDDDGNVVREFKNRDAFEIYKANLPTLVEEKPVSTFSVDVDTASYSFLRASLNRGQLPPRSSIRLEEMINYFPYDYEAPKSADEPFKANVTVTPNPWNADTKLMHIGIKGYAPPAAERPRSNIVFLIDTSGSMNQANKLPLLINSFKLLLNTLGDDDTVSIVTYAGSAGTVLEPTPASDKQKIKEALTRLRAGGSTAGAAGLELAYLKAQKSFDDEGVNRVILATDGDFNVGFSSPAEMKSFIAKKRETGIFLSVLGFGQGNYKDDRMQALAQNGNGVAAYIDTLAEANKVLADEAGSALYTIAKDVKIQVEFNPDTISEYRLIGYETRALKRQDFNNDKVDAGEIGAGHTVTAIYELTPVGSPAKVIDPLRYVNSKTSSIGSNEFAFVKIRHKLPNADKSTLQTFPIGPKQERSLRRSSDDMRFAAAVAAVGQKLRGDTQLGDFSYDEAIKLASGAKGKDEHGYRAEFIQLVRLAQSIDE